ncbi:PepSY-associated TM helix domain-containing protein [Variovorax ginsengisoli]|uniref:Iron-regulated membrane protein n=1 Tax=Variovorax ginsengisoli TaxID=363844 RepID=A0ABT9S8T9_9BURK|nr:PepSY-associated TM helix domain-containing protein [Variovorax ginsengisoli]MDP9899792.1 putative iron-regulated membrane protein [Variovorax ginsengisoli]
MKSGFRQSMAWLHTWCGLTAGWVLCAIFLTGTLSVFRDPITQWMTAKPVLSSTDAAGAGVDMAVDRAAAYLARVAPEARFWRIELASRPGKAIEMTWRSGKTDLQAAMHPDTGEILPQPWGRKTEGGRHFMSFHYTLHGGTAGYWVVGWLSMCMLVALVSGVVVHRRIFKDFFTFRVGRGQRSWLDAHNVTAVLTLPFLFMIVYTGLAFFYTSYLPWPLRAVYGMDAQAYDRFQSELDHHTPLRARPRSGTTATLHALAPLRQTAQSLIGRPVRRIVIEQPGDTNMRVRMFGSTESRTLAEATLLNPVGMVAFDGVTGAVLHVQQPTPPTAFSSEQIHGVIEALHLVRFGGWPLKWLYFISGLMGTAMMATGTVLFMVKRRRKSEMEFGAATATVYRLVEALTVSALAGICVACIAYLYANRWLPAAMPARDVWEIRAFLGVWALTLLHAGARPPARAWVEQLSLAAMLCLTLPLLNFSTTRQHLGSYLAIGDWQRGGVELVTLGLGAVMAGAAWQVHRGWSGEPAPVARNERTSPSRPAVAMRDRWAVLGRVFAASIGGYGAVALLAAAAAIALPRWTDMSRADGVLVATLLGFVFYTAVGIWAFSVRQAVAVWRGLALVSAACATLLALFRDWR